MTTIEQILLRLGIDQTQVGPALDNFEKRVEKSTKHAHAFYTHVGSSGRAFHKVLEKINEAVPGLGTAFQLVMNPIVGALAGATLAFSYFHKQIEETNKELDKMEEMAGRPIGNIKDAAREAGKEIEKMTREFDRWVDSHEDSGRRMKENLDKEIDGLKVAASLEEKRIRARGGPAGAVERQVREVQIDLGAKEVAARKAAHMEALTKFNDVNRELNQKEEDLRYGFASRARQTQIKNLPKSITELERQDKELEDRRKAAQKAFDTASGGVGGAGNGLQSPREYRDAQKALDDVTTQYENNRKALEKAKEHLDNLSEEQVKETDKVKQLQSEYDKLRGVLQGMSSAVDQAKLKLFELGAAPIPGQEAQTNNFRATIDEMARSGQWMTVRGPGGARGNIRGHYWQQGPGAQAARNVQGLEARAKYENLMGDFTGRDRDVAAARLIRDQLGASGALKSEEYLDSIKDDIAIISQLARTSGLIIQPTNGK